MSVGKCPEEICSRLVSRVYTSSGGGRYAYLSFTMDLREDELGATQ